MFSIGEFSKITGLTVKTLRFYHEEDLLKPSYVEPQTGYRYYEERQIEMARAIAHLRSLEFPLQEIKEILRLTGDQEFLDALQRQRAALQEKLKSLRTSARSLDKFISQLKEAATMAQTNYEVQEKTCEPILIAGIRMRGRYSDCGAAFARLGRSFGRFICGKPLLLHYDTEYREDDADFETCLPIRRKKIVEGVDVRELPGGRCLSIFHKGPYDHLGQAYAKILKYAKQKSWAIMTPTREVYWKGPGMIFKGNLKNYLTEIEMFVAPATS